ncbi:uncharacterized protein LOC129022255 [Pongo pygmaeus]|uniref:uncharacterized protein LOC129022255 n=1 Tax=Pongo pygmaeus TaxID=9600 RepID=UPI0023E14E05|nr:uncharacterized protein LOC129022255 [Pongo pygmaeus]
MDKAIGANGLGAGSEGGYHGKGGKRTIFRQTNFTPEDPGRAPREPSSRPGTTSSASVPAPSGGGPADWDCGRCSSLEGAMCACASREGLRCVENDAKTVGGVGSCGSEGEGNFLGAGEGKAVSPERDLNRTSSGLLPPAFLFRSHSANLEIWIWLTSKRKAPEARSPLFETPFFKLRGVSLFLSPGSPYCTAYSYPVSLAGSALLTRLVLSDSTPLHNVHYLLSLANANANA